MKKLFYGFAVLLFVVAMSGVPSWAQNSAAQATPIDLPPKVGDMAPDFTLPSSAKLSPMKLSDMRGKKKILLAYYVFDFTGG
jgi:hypothetical protein